MKNKGAKKADPYGDGPIEKALVFRSHDNSIVGEASATALEYRAAMLWIGDRDGIPLKPQQVVDLLHVVAAMVEVLAPKLGNLGVEGLPAILRPEPKEADNARRN